VQALLATDGVTDLGVSFGAGEGRTPSFARKAMGRVGVVHVKSPEDTSSPDSVRVAQRLAKLTGSLVVDDMVSDTAIVMTGGDTARSVLDRLGVQVLGVRRSLAPGVVLSKADLGGRSVCMVTKAGGFGETDLFARIVRQLLEKH
jgi:4-hydroxythreonine-4-phosphate dehydrogenase